MKNNVDIFKCLSERSRIHIINALLEKPMYVELLAERLALANSTVSFHLKKLEAANLVYSIKEQYYMVYHLNEEILDKTLRSLIEIKDIDKKIEEERIDQHREKIINSFFKYNELISIPVQQKKRKIVLNEIAKSFKEDVVYTEEEVNIILKKFYEDYCTLRRGLISDNILKRNNGLYIKEKGNECEEND